MQPTLSDLKNWSYQAGEILRAGYGQQHQIHNKGLVDLVTEVDHLSEALLMERIQQRFPSHTIITEESGHISGRGDGCWYIDPLDGTVNYAHGVPIFCTSLAYTEGGQIKLGVVYDPLREECYSAELGKGAWLNDQPIHVSDTGELIKSLLVTGFPYDTWSSPKNNLVNFERFARRTQGVRRLGSAALDLCYVACGRLDGFWELKIGTYDIAAGGLIAREAGAIVTAMDGKPDFLAVPCSILAANPALHPLMLEVLQEGEDT